MSPLGDFLRRPFGEQPLSLRLAVGVSVAGGVAASIAVATGGEDRPAQAPSPVLTRPERDAPPLVENTQLPRARASARAFAQSYLEVLYGRAEAEEIVSATDALRRRVERELIRVPPTRAELRPSIVALRVAPHDATTATAEVLVDDADAPRYPLRFELSAARGRWLVWTLLND